MSQKTIRVVVAEDHPLMRSALAETLQSLPDVAIAGEAGTMEELEQMLRQKRPDVLVLDLFLHKQCVLYPLRVYLQDHPEVRALVISAHGPELYAPFSQRIGARGFISKRALPEELKSAIQRIIRGEEVWPEDVLGAELRHSVSSSGRESPTSSLSLREMEVFRLIGRWKNTEEIAGELGISSSTVEIHRVHIRKKLGFSSAGDLLHFAVEQVGMERG